ncbi:hypothetical protein [Candidatus Enterovibrio escicola]|uniref:Uncharacterized protein n=1 Tax=Candidatus Enterovibrio escicola TaxID=1927127 RepID=A0A2A5T775_9GAMM|nr:hypothetical protein [Candidatus Enterovibrio escacola]PCS24023.1 hypothetical protein BTN49_0296 [Candidatus Enterovibrio escacola]
MKFNRQSLKNSEKKVKDIDSFIDGADAKSIAGVNKDSSRIKRELTKPVSISLTDTDRKTLDNQAKRFNLLSYQLELNYDKQLNRSDIVRLVANNLAKMSDEDFMEFVIR